MFFCCDENLHNTTIYSRDFVLSRSKLIWFQCRQKKMKFVSNGGAEVFQPKSVWKVSSTFEHETCVTRLSSLVLYNAIMHIFGLGLSIFQILKFKSVKILSLKLLVDQKSADLKRPTGFTRSFRTHHHLICSKYTPYRYMPSLNI